MKRLQHLPDFVPRTVLFVGTAAAVTLPMSAVYPLIGLDFIYYLPRLADTFLYHEQNGLSIQWWTPSFGGGLPVFPNPHDLQLSLPQLFTFFANPFIAVCVTVALVILASCYALHRLAHRVLGWDEASACLLAVAASTGGFLTMRMAVGHTSYHAFALTPVLLLIAMDRKIPKRLAVPLAGLLGTYFVYSGGSFVSFAAPLALGMAMPVVLVLAPRARPLLSAIGVLSGGAAVALVLSAAKLFAAFSYMRSFPRLQVSEPLPSVFSPIVQLVGTPLVTLFGVVESPSQFHHALFGQPWGPWETDASLSMPVAIAAFVALPSLLWHVLRRGTARERGLTSLAVAIGVFVVGLTAARGPVFELLEQLPGASNFRVPARFAGALGLPVCLVGVFALSEVARRWRAAAHRSSVVWVLVGLALLQQAGYVSLVGRHAKDLVISFDAGDFLLACDHFRANPQSVPPIVNVDRVTDPVAVATSRSSLLIYEPLIGVFFNHRSFLRRTPLRAGPASSIQNGAFNLHYPPAISYSESVGMPPFSRIPATDRENLDLFLSRRAPSWELPAGQHTANATSLAGLGLTGAWLLALLHLRMRRRRSW